MGCAAGRVATAQAGRARRQHTKEYNSSSRGEEHTSTGRRENRCDMPQVMKWLRRQQRPDPCSIIVGSYVYIVGEDNNKRVQPPEVYSK